MQPSHKSYNYGNYVYDFDVTNAGGPVDDTIYDTRRKTVKEAPVEYFDASVDINVVVSNDAAIATATLFLDGEEYQSSATAKRHPEDKPNDEIGMKLALGRVLGSVARKLERQAEGLVKHAEDMREYRKEQQSANPLGLRAGDRFKTDLSDSYIYTVTSEPYQSGDGWKYPVRWTDGLGENKIHWFVDDSVDVEVIKLD